ncbi:MAG: tRNA pseudouridine(55) synthase, partial [Duncaniella sp.]|nr:tRNA pseudouridine(55) synthase [Duncaniella sp.]
MDFITGEVLYIDKPLEWTSFDVVKRVRGVLLHRLHKKKMKVGHAGTLDPLATGVMIVVTGRATKRIEELQAGVKEYVATIQLGATTPSFDLETEIDAVHPAEHITMDLIDLLYKS